MMNPSFFPGRFVLIFCPFVNRLSSGPIVRTQGEWVYFRHSTFQFSSHYEETESESLFFFFFSLVFLFPAGRSFLRDMSPYHGFFGRFFGVRDQNRVLMLFSFLCSSALRSATGIHVNLAFSGLFFPSRLPIARASPLNARTRSPR